ncbi:MAG: hypothetical protein ACYTGW_05935 [Planctomycetota bacterium]|jgi:hypothetical protein
MRPVTVFVLLLFASGVAGGDLCARTLAAQCLAHMPAQDRVPVCVQRMATRVGARASAHPGRGPCAMAPRTRHRRIVGCGILPAPRAPDLRPEIA